MNVKTLSSPYGNCSNCDLKVRVSLNLQLESVKSFKILFSALFFSIQIQIQIQISRFSCNPPMSGKEFHLIKELTYSRLTAICAFEPLFFAYLLCGSLLKCWPKVTYRLHVHACKFKVCKTRYIYMTKAERFVPIERKVTSSLAAIQRPGRRAWSCEMVY